MATVYSTTLTDSTGATSGILDVSTHNQAWLVINVTAIDWAGSATAVLSRIDAADTLIPVATLPLQMGLNTAEVGIGCATNVILGDHLQLDVMVFDTTSVSGTISLIGK